MWRPPPASEAADAGTSSQPDVDMTSDQPLPVPDPGDWDAPPMAQESSAEDWVPAHESSADDWENLTSHSSGAEWMLTGPETKRPHDPIGEYPVAVLLARLRLRGVRVV